VDEKIPGTSLIAAPAGPAVPAGRFRPNAPIVTQLFAMKLDMPQARARCRARTEEGVAAYGATGTALRLARRSVGESWPA
jgi:hypothetical protein